MKDYIGLALAVSPLIALPLGIVLVANSVWIGIGFITYACACGFSCIRLLADMAAHGVHNDR